MGTGGRDHVGLLAGLRSDGSPVVEQVPARKLGEGLYLILGSPGLANGCAEGDTVAVDSDGAFEVSERGGNVAVHIYSGTTVAEPEAAELDRLLQPLRGKCERHPQGRFAVATIPVQAGFPAIESTMQAWASTGRDIEWFFGNVYADDGAPLNWWD